MSAWFAAFLLGLVGFGPAEAQPLDGIALPDANERERLETGAVVLRSQESDADLGLAAVSIGVIEAPAEAVWALVRECDQLVRFMPRLVSSEELAGEGGGSVCRTVVDMPFPFSDLVSEVAVTQERIGEAGYRSRWTLLRGDFQRNRGYWAVLPWGESRALLIHSSDVVPRSILPDWVLQRVQHQMLRNAILGARDLLGETREAEATP